MLTEAGIKVERVESLGVDFPKVVVAQIIDSQPHPNADRLRVCRVNDGSGTERQIVCGARNYKIGDKVPLALPGAVLPGDFRIKVGKLRGVESEGMMCSGRELGITEDSEGLLILGLDAVVGEPISSVFPPDVFLELEITPNRVDWLSHLGVAREVAAFTGAALKFPESQPFEVREHESVARIDDRDACPFYSLRKISRVRVGPSPDWLRSKLEAVGLRSINNVVDVTNFVMFECGQPLHAFDAAKVSGGVVVRDAVEGEKFSALDGRTYELKPGQLVIADGRGVLGLAGIMGGEESGVTESTTEVLLESAFFESSGIRRTSRALQLQSDSSYRFERGVALDGVLDASARAADLINEIAEGLPEAAVAIAGERSRPALEVSLRRARCNALLGVDFPGDYIAELLTRAGCVLTGGDDETSRWIAPGFRNDLHREVDLIEEVVRLHGIANIPSRTANIPAPSSEADRAYDFAQSLRALLAGRGFLEGRTSTLVGAGAGQGGVALRNPMGGEQSHLRPSLVSGLLDALGRNIRHGAESVRLFEIGRVFHSSAPEERTHIALVVTGSLDEVSWKAAPRQADIFVLKGIIAWLLPGIEFTSVTDERAALALDLVFGGKTVGRLGQLSPAESAAFDARQPVVFAEWNLDLARQSLAGRKADRFVMPRFPGTTRDIAVVIPKSTTWEEIEAALRGGGEELLYDIRLFDVFVDPSGEKLPIDRKSLAFSLTFRSSGRTLESGEVQVACERLKKLLREKTGAEFRE